MSTSDKTARTAADRAAASQSSSGQLAWDAARHRHTSGQLKMDSNWIENRPNLKHCSKSLCTNVNCGCRKSVSSFAEAQRIVGEMFHSGHQTMTLTINSSSKDQVHIIDINLKAWLLWESKCVMAEFQNSKITLWHRHNSPSFHLLNYHLSGCFITCLDLLCSGVRTEAWQRVLICHIKNNLPNWRRFKNLETTSWATLDWNVLWYFDALWRLEQKAKYWPHLLFTEINRVCSGMSEMYSEDVQPGFFEKVGMFYYF